MLGKNKYQIIAGVLLILAGIAGSLTLNEGKYSLICLLGLMFLLTGSRSTK